MLRKMLVILLFGCLSFLNNDLAQAQTITLPAFPGAEGFGARATGGRGGKVIYVTTLAADGPGSLREALRTPGPRYILFKVSGVIDAAAEIVHGDVTIAGQTSPRGVVVRGLVCDGHYEGNTCNNIIVQHLRSRPAAYIKRPGAGPILDDALRLDGIENAIIDHSSFALAEDEAIQLSLARNVTIQNSILAETVGEHHPYGGMLINYSHSSRPLDNLTIHHNLWFRISGRMPEISCELTRGIGPDDKPETPSFCGTQPLNLELSNNLLWDPGGPITYNDNSAEGKGQPEAGLFALNLNWVSNYAVVRADYSYGLITPDFIAQPKNTIYAAGNRVNLYPTLTDFQLAYCCDDFPQNGPNKQPPDAKILRSRHNFPAVTYTRADQLPLYVQNSVGAFPRDQMDNRIITTIRSGKIDILPRDKPVREDGFTLTFDPKSPPPFPTDSDNDGMPDSWEIGVGLDPKVQDHNGMQISQRFLGRQGYTNLDVYLSLLNTGLAGTRTTVPAFTLTPRPVPTNPPPVRTGTPPLVLTGNVADQPETLKARQFGMQGGGYTSLSVFLYLFSTGLVIVSSRKRECIG